MDTKGTKYKDQVFQRLLIERMQQLRAEYGYSQEDVIEYTHLDISRYESGTSMPSTLSILKLYQHIGLLCADKLSSQKRKGCLMTTNILF